MKQYPLTNLSNLRENHKFIWNNTIYTVYQREGNMIEVHSVNGWSVWPIQARVNPIFN